MKKTTALVAAVAVLSLTACAKNDNKNANPAPSPAAPTNTDPTPAPAKIEMPNVKYPAAIVFEGGKGDPWFDQENTKHTPTWRLYICLEKTAEKASGQVTLDLVTLGSAINQTWQNSKTQEVLYTERLNKVVLNYTYTTELSDDPANNYGYAYGKAAIDIQSQQYWELLYLAPNETHAHDAYEDLDFFNIDINSGTVTQFGQTKFQINGENFYISNYLDRFTYSEKDNRAHVVEACEKANKPYVLQVGNEMTLVK